MKIRSDFVSNSSSSSFVIFGNKVAVGTEKVVEVHGKTIVERSVEHPFDVSMFDNMSPDEAYFIIIPNAGSEGDYIFRLTPELLMDCDMHQIDLCKFPIIRAKYFMTECGYTYVASQYSTGDDCPEVDDSIRTKLKGDGLPMDGLKAFRYSKDYGNPSYRGEILEEMENHCKYNR